MTTHRLFVSVDLDAFLWDAVSEVQKPFTDLPGVRTVDPRGAHVTLKFLGNVPDDRLDDTRTFLEDAITSAGVDPFTARFGHIGVFPSYDYISVIWLGVPTGGSELARLHEAIEDRFVQAGFEQSDHEFTPHVTIARVDHAGAKSTIQELVRTRDPMIGSMTVFEVRLTESTSTESGPDYETIERVTLAHTNP